MGWSAQGRCTWRAREPVSCTPAQMGSCRTIDMQLWSAADHEPLSWTILSTRVHWQNVRADSTLYKAEEDAVKCLECIATPASAKWKSTMIQFDRLCVAFYYCSVSKYVSILYSFCDIATSSEPSSLAPVVVVVKVSNRNQSLSWRLQTDKVSRRRCRQANGLAVEALQACFLTYCN